MPYKDEEHARIYNLGYQTGRYNGARYVTIHHLGAKCEKCGEMNIRYLEVAHRKKVNKTHRHIKDWLNLDELYCLCKRCNQRDENVSRYNEFEK